MYYRLSQWENVPDICVDLARQYNGVMEEEERSDPEVSRPLKLKMEDLRQRILSLGCGDVKDWNTLQFLLKKPPTPVVIPPTPPPAPVTPSPAPVPEPVAPTPIIKWPEPLTPPPLIPEPIAPIPPPTPSPPPTAPMPTAPSPTPVTTCPVGYQYDTASGYCLPVGSGQMPLTFTDPTTGEPVAAPGTEPSLIKQAGLGGPMWLLLGAGLVFALFAGGGSKQGYGRRPGKPKAKTRATKKRKK